MLIPIQNPINRPTHFARLMGRICWLWVLAIAMAMPARAQLDICGCADLPESLGAFDTNNPASYPAGSISGSRTLQIPLPADGVMVFDSMAVNVRNNEGFFITVSFIRNNSNTPATILVKGNVTIGGSATLSVRGNDGSAGSTGVNGVGGLGGPGGFRGGDGAYQLVNFVANGGFGLGPGGGAGGTGSPLNSGIGGNFVGIPELLPLVGGGGGGGGASSSNVANASGGGGGGGGGALLIVANGTITVNGTIDADGGNGGNVPDATFASRAHGGSGGAIRLVAATINGSGSLFARGGMNPFGSRAGSGRVRMEAFTNTMSATNTDPIASRSAAPGPIVNPFTPTLKVVSVGGQIPPTPPQGVFGVVDVILPVPGPTPIVIESNGVTIGTIIRVKVKPRVGGEVLTQDIVLGEANSNCNGAGVCTSTVTMDLAAGAFTVEAQATLQTPSN